MDIQHISALIETLSSLGFSSSTARMLLFHACLGQKDFAIKEQIRFGEDTINYQLYFKEETATKSLTCAHYDATLKKAIEIGNSVVNGVNISQLGKRMTTVNWQMHLEVNAAAFDISDKNTWKREAIIEEITMDLELLASTTEGADVATLLKYKFWTDTTLQNIIPELPGLKSKYELSQRFYIINRDGITANEAYRFLNNRWMERKIHADNRLLRQNEPEQKQTKAAIKESKKNKKRRLLPRENVGK